MVRQLLVFTLVGVCIRNEKLGLVKVETLVGKNRQNPRSGVSAVNIDEPFTFAGACFSWNEKPGTFFSGKVGKQLGKKKLDLRSGVFVVSAVKIDEPSDYYGLAVA